VSGGSPAELITTRLLLVRHGESNATVHQLVGGTKGCTGLSELGRQQSARLRDRLAAGFEPTVDVLLASSLPRAIETAEIINECLRLELRVDIDLEEHRPGDADGLGWRDVEARFGPYEGSRYPHRRLAPGAESIAEFQHRVGATLDRLVGEHLGRCLLLSCHGGVIDMAFRGVLGLNHRTTYDLWTLNTSITELAARHPPGVHPDRWRLVRYNDAAHLAGLPAATPPVDRTQERDPRAPDVSAIAVDVAEEDGQPLP
jgi:probable phosphoglycerate mutase